MIGPSASGKSTLARLLVGAWPAAVGTVRLDGADIYQWDKDQLGPHIGYLPQDIELFGGSIAENIARFGQIDSQLVIEAAQLAGVHDMILRLPQGYDTLVGDAGAGLSGGQKQRIGLARALYRNPALIVLDEPNSNLDEIGEAALKLAIDRLRAAGKTVVLITHRTSIIAATTKLLLLVEGQLRLFGETRKYSPHCKKHPHSSRNLPPAPRHPRTIRPQPLTQRKPPFDPHSPMSNTTSKKTGLPAVEIVGAALPPTLNTDESRYVKAGWTIVLVGVVGSLLWATFAPLSKGVPVQSTVVVTGNRKEIQHPTGGIIQNILVHDGDQVKAGQVLVTMNNVQAQSEESTVRAQYLTELAMKARLSRKRRTPKPSRSRRNSSRVPPRTTSRSKTT